eukprot:CAMPEP_0172636640 /NCGR_PEP_ID=MMETSP1068-20121228/205072_1 /TAXON_ID=35684 /ORGANISM="Pseudopedinella elastica, Strain CCMP716" /LENGTH=61 /DNA_ID=CAMNT_0013449121 /DNA_START=30 /DNA_END=213 /DNA_ORIENTATION=-
MSGSTADPRAHLPRLPKDAPPLLGPVGPFESLDEALDESLADAETHAARPLDAGHTMSGRR